MPYPIHSVMRIGLNLNWFLYLKLMLKLTMADIHKTFMRNGINL